MVSANPSGDFDGPEPMELWQSPSPTTPSPTSSPTTAVEDSVLIARPAHVTLPLSTFTEILSDPRWAAVRARASLYLEYFPLYNLGAPVRNTTRESYNSSHIQYSKWYPKSKRGKSSKSRRSRSRGRKSKGRVEGAPARAAGVNISREYGYTDTHSELQLQVPPVAFAQWLGVDHQLVWMGSGMELPQAGSDSPTPTPPAAYANPVGRLHFDRNENLMLMITGSKVFTLLDPAQSEWVYGDLPIRQASLEVHIDTAASMLSMYICVCI